ncbi:MAG TPA: CPBP family intramembrane glutamic endopeptidase [Streptosporangiaceae bacterium]
MARPEGTGFALATCATLTAYNNLFGLHRWHRRWYVPINACAAGAALSAAAASGLSAADLGLGRGAWRPGRLAVGLAAATCSGWLLSAVVPAAHPVLADKRVTSLDGRAAAYGAVVRIPVGTVLWEEIAFRGVLHAALRRVMPERAAIVASAAVFGLWHIRPTAEALRANGLTRGRGLAVANVTAGCAATAAGGLVLSWLRARSGSLAAPMLVHLATNSGGQVAAWAVAGRARRAPRLGISALMGPASAAG